MDSDSHILLVEDDDDVRAITAELLESEGYVVVTARDGAEAIELLRNSRPSAILTDLRMPVVDGWQLLSQIETADHLQGVPVAVMTAEPVAPPGYPVLRKPLNAHAVLAFVQAHVKDRQPSWQELSLRATSARDELRRLVEGGIIRTATPEVADAIARAAAALSEIPASREAIKSAESILELVRDSSVTKQ